QGQCEGIEQNRLAGTCLSGENGEAVGKVNVEPIDQNDVANRQPGKHCVSGCPCPADSHHQRRGWQWKSSPSDVHSLLIRAAQVGWTRFAVTSRSWGRGNSEQGLAQADALERLADPGPLVLLRLDAASLYQRIGVLVPGAVWEVVPEN